MLCNVRRMTEHDGADVAALMLKSADSGKFAIAPKYLVNPFSVEALGNQTIGFVSEHPEHGIVGVGFIRFRKILLNGVKRNAAYLFGLFVHPAWRKKGIGSQLANTRVAVARERYGDSVLLLASIQAGNQGSFSVANGWATHYADVFVTTMSRVRQRSPRLPVGYSIRHATELDYQLVTEQLNHFYRDYTLYTPKCAMSHGNSTESLPRQLNNALRPISHFLLLDQTNKPLAGITISEEFRIRTMLVPSLSFPMRAVNKIVRLIPPSGELRPVTCSDLWHTDNSANAARLLFQAMRYRYRDSADILLYTYDQKSSLGNIIQPPFWILKGKLSLAANEPIPTDTPLYPVR